jgi:hypothetical protein
MILLRKQLFLKGMGIARYFTGSSKTFTQTSPLRRRVQESRSARDDLRMDFAQLTAPKMKNFLLNSLTIGGSASNAINTKSFTDEMSKRKINYEVLEQTVKALATYLASPRRPRSEDFHKYNSSYLQLFEIILRSSQAVKWSSMDDAKKKQFLTSMYFTKIAICTVCQYYPMMQSHEEVIQLKSFLNKLLTKRVGLLSTEEIIELIVAELSCPHFDIPFTIFLTETAFPRLSQTKRPELIALAMKTMGNNPKMFRWKQIDQKPGITQTKILDPFLDVFMQMLKK